MAVQLELEAYQPEKFRAFLGLITAISEGRMVEYMRSLAISGKSGEPSPLPISDSATETSPPTPSVNGPISTVSGGRGKQRETTRRLV